MNYLMRKETEGMKYWKYSIAVLVCLLAVSPVLAQGTRGGIQGTVADEEGVDLPGVTVVLTSPSMQGTRTEVTGENGYFRFSLLPTGTYKAVFSLPSYQTVEHENIRVLLEGMVTLDVGLNSTFAEEVMVTGESPVVDVTSPAIGSLIGGFLADSYGFNAVNWMAVVAAGLSVVVLWIWLRPGEQRIRDAAPDRLDSA